MFRKVSFTLLILICSAFSASCHSKSPTSYRPPNQNELQVFSKDQGINPVTDKLLNDSVVLLYEKGSSFGYYMLTVREPDRAVVVSHNVSAAKSDQPILIMAQLSGDQPFMTVVIQDRMLLAETHAIEVVIDSQNRVGATTDGRTGVVLVWPSPVKDWKTVLLKNAQGKVIYSQGSYPLQQLRIMNSGREDIKDLTVLFPGLDADAEATRIEFGDVPAGEATSYQYVPGGVFRYAAYEYTLDSGVVKQAVTDWVGESPMQGEKFTYQIELDSQKQPGNQVQLKEVKVEKQ